MKILVAVLALGLAFWGYAFVYRGKTEPPAKYPVTNQDAAVYSLRGQIQMLSQQEELNTFAFEGRKKETITTNAIKTTNPMSRYFKALIKKKIKLNIN